MEQIIAVLLGFVASWLQGGKLKSLNLSDKATSRLRFVVSLVTPLLAGFALHYGDFMLNGEFNWAEVFANFGLMFATSQTYYNTYFKHKE